MFFSKGAQKGFTLLEILVVMVLIVIFFSLIVTSITSGLANKKAAQISNNLIIAIRQTRSHSITTGKPSTLIFDLQKKCYSTPSRPVACLPSGVDIQVTTAASNSSKEIAIIFFPDGSSSGGHIYLIKDNLKQRLNINWLTGNARVEEI